MNILFLTLAKISNLSERGIYQDLLVKFRDNGHNVFVVCPIERRLNRKTELFFKDGINILQVRTFNIQKTNIIEKGIGTFFIEFQYLKAIKQYLEGIKFDIILYSTPPITLIKVIEYIKIRDNSFTYLLLKDIFPQNAIDIHLIKEKSFIHNYFLKKEKRLYELSDTIGCMSEANVNYLIKNNTWLDKSKIEVNPNSILPIEFQSLGVNKKIVREKYNLPNDKKIFIYGGNLGKPQGLEFLLETIRQNNNSKVFFLIVGDGTEYSKIFNWFKLNSPMNAMLIKFLPKSEYDELLMACDVGLVFLDPNFTIPNFPSRLLSYLEMKKPVIAATDNSTDIGDIIEKFDCGFKVLSGDFERMQFVINKFIEENKIEDMGLNGWNLLKSEYNIDISYNLIMARFRNFINV